MQIGVAQSATREMSFVATQDVIVALPNDTTVEDLTYGYDGVEIITPEVELGTTLGTVSVRQGDNLLYAQEIVYEEAPEFYNYGWVVAGGGVSAALLILTLGLAWRAVRQKRHKKYAWLWPVLVGALCLASVVANLLIFGKWFDEPGATEVVWPEELVRELN